MKIEINLMDGLDQIQVRERAEEDFVHDMENRIFSITYSNRENTVTLLLRGKELATLGNKVDEFVEFKRISITKTI